MSDFLTYFPEGKEFVGYRKITFSTTTISYFERIAEESLSTERSQRKIREENEHKNIMEFLTQQIIDREERAKRIAENQNALIDNLKREQKRKREKEEKGSFARRKKDSKNLRRNWKDKKLNRENWKEKKDRKDLIAEKKSF